MRQNLLVSESVRERRERRNKIKVMIDRVCSSSLQNNKHFYIHRDVRSPPPPINPNPPNKKKITPFLPSEHRGWNTGKGDCGHYCSHLDFSVHIGTVRGIMDERIKN